MVDGGDVPPVCLGPGGQRPFRRDRFMMYTPVTAMAATMTKPMSMAGSFGDPGTTSRRRRVFPGSVLQLTLETSN